MAFLRLTISRRRRGDYKLILGLQSISRDVADNVSHPSSHPRRLDPTMELITYSFVLYLQHGRHDVKCKPSIYEYRLVVITDNIR